MPVPETTIPPRPKAGNVRWWPRDDAPGWLVEMAATGGWLMVRRPGAMPFVMSLEEWNALPWNP